MVDYSNLVNTGEQLSHSYLRMLLGGHEVLVDLPGIVQRSRSAGFSGNGSARVEDGPAGLALSVVLSLWDFQVVLAIRGAVISTSARQSLSASSARQGMLAALLAPFPIRSTYFFPAKYKKTASSPYAI